MSRIPLEEMLKALQSAVRFLPSTYEEFKGDEKTYFAVIRAFEIAGEATRRLDAAFCEAHPEIPWAKFAGMRNMLIHQYHRVDLRIVWESARDDAPPMIKMLQKLLSELPKPR